MEERHAGRRVLKKNGPKNIYIQNVKQKDLKMYSLSLFRPVKILGLRGNERISGQLFFLRWPLDRSGRSKKGCTNQGTRKRRFASLLMAGGIG